MTYINYNFLEKAICSDSTNSSIADKVLEAVIKQVINKSAEIIINQTFETAPYVISYIGETINSNYTYYLGGDKNCLPMYYSEESSKQEAHGIAPDYTDIYDIV